MLPKGARREEVLERLEEHGGLRPGVAREVSRETGVPEADVYGVATFYHLLAEPDAGVRVCRGLSCKLHDCDAAMTALREADVPFVVRIWAWCAILSSRAVVSFSSWKT